MGGLVAVGQPALAAAHTCNGSEQFVTSTTGARVCYYDDTATYKICDTATGNHPAVTIYYGDGTSATWHEYPGYNKCGPEYSLDWDAIGMRARNYNGSTLVNSGPLVLFA
ncbi:hypothetical protein [Dactylosporangium sp. NPDC000521]|uniref:hypothetical protein n=1 Tax=Dactylosporangium sp. NPDC000521 TaxID=3363975 RepID=UPI0036BB72FA